jgi:hypothetical protein
MSFRKKHREAEKAEGEDVKIAHAKDSQGAKKKSAQEQSSEQQSVQQTGQQANQQSESGQSSEQSAEQESEETDDEQSPAEEEDDDSAEPVPDGTTAEILRWVGDDKRRAQRALDKEHGDEKPRAGLTGELKKIVEE